MAKQLKKMPKKVTVREGVTPGGRGYRASRAYNDKGKELKSSRHTYMTEGSGRQGPTAPTKAGKQGYLKSLLDALHDRRVGSALVEPLTGLPISKWARASTSRRQARSPQERILMPSETNINVTKRETRTGVRWRIDVSKGLSEIDEGLAASIEVSDEDARTLWGKLGQGLEVATTDGGS